MRTMRLCTICDSVLEEPERSDSITYERRSYYVCSFNCETAFRDQVSSTDEPCVTPTARYGNREFAGRVVFTTFDIHYSSISLAGN